VVVSSWRRLGDVGVRIPPAKTSATSLSVPITLSVTDNLELGLVE
jgi:hypothetical protein